MFGSTKFGSGMFGGGDTPSGSVSPDPIPDPIPDSSNAPVIAISTIMRCSTINLTAPITDTINLTANLL